MKIDPLVWQTLRTIVDYSVTRCDVWFWNTEKMNGSRLRVHR